MAGKNWHNLSFDEVTRILNADIKEGLSETEVKSRQEKFGKNRLPEEKPLSSLRIFLEQFKSPLIYILVIAGIATLFLKDFKDAIIIFGAVFLNTVIGFFQENKTSKILAELKKIVKIKAYVLREGSKKETEQGELVPGDIFILQPGDKIPADGRLIESHNLKINESALTGEWVSSKKNINVLAQTTPLADRDNMVYMGTIVEDGWGKAVVTETGINTEIGKVAKLVKETKEEKTPYQNKVIHLSKIIGILILIFSFLIFIFGVAVGRELLEMFLTAVAVAVAAIPEGLPMAITIILALGAQRILKKRGLVRKMIAAETLGSTSIICTDKTGTLTEAKMQVAGIYTSTKELLSDGQKYSEEIDKNGLSSHILALKIGALCSEAFVENPEAPLEKWIVRGRATDKAILIASIQAGINKKELEKENLEIERLPFDPVYKYSVRLYKLSEKEFILYSLGSPEKILEMSEYFDIDGKKEVLTEEEKEKIKMKMEKLASRGERVLATGYKSLEIKNSKELKIEEETNNLTFVGLISLHDPIRKEVKGAIKTCREAGMRPIIVTGDHKLTAKAIAEKLGLPSGEKNIIEGSELDKLSNEEIEKRLKEVEIYARVEPVQKLKIIEFWQEKGEVVAMTGDGINDAPALKKADIGLALGSGTDVAKEASDLVLLSDNFSVIVSAIKEGRQILDNIRKVVTYLLSDSFSELILISVSIFFGMPLPILPGQILWVNLIEDSLPSLSLSFEPKEKDIMKRKPENPKSPLLTKEMRSLIFIIGIFTDLLLLGLFLWLLKKGLPLQEIRTIIFAGLAIDSLFYVFSCKNLRKNIWQINIFSNKILLFSWVWGIIMLFAAIYLPPLQSLLKTYALSLFDWGLILGLGMLNLILIEGTKYYFISKKQYD